jgi:hypothetical protein
MLICNYVVIRYVHSETPDWDGIEPPPNPGQDSKMKSLIY